MLRNRRRIRMRRCEHQRTRIEQFSLHRILFDYRHSRYPHDRTLDNQHTEIVVIAILEVAQKSIVRSRIRRLLILLRMVRCWLI